MCGWYRFKTNQLSLVHTKNKCRFFWRTSVGMHDARARVCEYLTRCFLRWAHFFRVLQCDDPVTSHASPMLTSGWSSYRPGEPTGLQTDLETESECSPCPPGHYCIDGNITSTCTGGYFCKTGIDDPTPNRWVLHHRRPAHETTHTFSSSLFKTQTLRRRNQAVYDHAHESVLLLTVL